MYPTNNREEPLLCPHLFAGGVLRTKWFVVEVRWKRGIVSESIALSRYGLSGRSNDHVEGKVQLFLWFAIWGIPLERGCEKRSNSSRDPIEKLVLAGKGKRVGWMEVEFKEFLARKVNPWLYIPHVGYMENIEELLTMVCMMWSPRAVSIYRLN